MRDHELAESDARGGLASESGTTLILVAGLLVVLLGMAAFAVDLGWLYYQQTNARKAAEAAALAGVIHVPPVGSWGSGEEAYQTAIDVAERAGYATGVLPELVPGEDYQLKVTVDTTVNTFFLRVFGKDSFAISESAVAEALPAVRMGSDGPTLGNAPGYSGVPNPNFWLAVNGTRTPKGQGDPFTPECYGEFFVYEPWLTCSGDNFEWSNPSYWYAVEVPPSEVGGSLSIHVYDPQTNENDPESGAFDTDDTDEDRDPITTFTVYRPDDTPLDPTDNTDEICSRDYAQRGRTGYDSNLRNDWDQLCPAETAVRGVYVIEVSVSPEGSEDGVDMTNGWSLAGEINGSISNDLAVYGIGAMSIWTPSEGVSTFNLAYVPREYAGEQLIVGLWDIGDSDEDGTLDFVGSLDDEDCEYRVLDDHGNVIEDWQSDHDGDNGHCHLEIDAVQVEILGHWYWTGEHNNEWIEVRFDIDDGHDCSGSACWAKVHYGTDDPHDRTTWTVGINGQPVHLLPSG